MVADTNSFGQAIPDVTVYRLRDPRNDEVRYIGATMMPLKKSLQGHMGAARSGYSGWKGARTVWINELDALGLLPVIEPIETVDGQQGAAREHYHIEQARIAGLRLVNSPGGKRYDNYTLPLISEVRK